MKLNYLLALLLLAVMGNPVLAQVALNDIPDDLAAYYAQRKAEAIAYAIANDLPVRQVFADGTIMEIQFLDESGRPLYYKTFNVEAAFTTGTNKLYEGSDLGLFLSGKGIKVGIWDAGLVRATHVEFENRAQIVEGSEVTVHATHVTGTILARGVNPVARGMAFEATSVNYDGLNGDGSEMKTEAQNGLLLSNHSYGTVLGWSYNSTNGSWQWVGDVSVSSLEDYRFGYYSSAAAIWDDIAFANPYYLIVKSAGNDRTDVGDGNGPPADGPYDIIGPQGIAKNVLTIGSVNPLTSPYTSPADVTMAPYSSWGPSDDGRIKPDIVGMGQNLLSTSSETDTSYTTLSGTSMSAPNVTGSLALLQQLYYQQNKAYLTAAALKALVIHTTYETGVADGPDYQYGWGLLNSAGASKMLMLNGRPGFMIKQDSLTEGEAYTLAVDNVGANQKLTVTVVWTDPAGEAETVAAVDPPALKLVNDLDVRVKDSSGTTYLPWVMDPDTKQAAKGDNFRDNVEKIELLTPVAGTYTITITHKGTLLNGKQDFALIVSAENIDSKLKAFYFIGANNNFLDPLNWSDVSGGAAVNQSPGINDIVIFDENSIGTLAQAKITIPADFSCFSFAASGSLPFEFDLNGNTLFVESNLAVTNNNFLISNGLVNIGAQDISGSVQVGPNSFSAISLLISDNNKPANLLSGLVVDTLIVRNGWFNTNGQAITASALSIENSKVEFGGTKTSGLNAVSVTGASAVVVADQASFIFDGSNTGKLFVGGGFDYGVIRAMANDLTVSQLNLVDSLVVGSQLIIAASNSANVVEIMPSASLLIGDGQELFINKSLFINSSSAGRVTLANFPTGGTTVGSIKSETNPKFCFDYVDVTNVNATGNTRFVVGANSTLTNTNGWIQGNCQDVLASGFTYQYTCSGGVTYFTDTSDGSPDSWSWDFGDGSMPVSEQNPAHTFLDTGTYVVRLTVTSGAETSVYAGAVLIELPTIASPAIVLDNNQLRSTAFSENYQWYLDAQPIAGATDYFLTNFSAPGAYHIEIWNNQCRLASPPYVVTGLDDPLSSLHIFPNPFENSLIIETKEKGPVQVTVLDITGKPVYIQSFANVAGRVVLDTSGFKEGLYLLSVEQRNNQETIRIIKLK